MNIAQFLIERLKTHGVNHAFGIPGDYILNFYDQLSKSIKVIGTTDEQGAGFAADAYARINGIGCVCTTYCVGGFKLINAIGGAYAEKSPVIVISGAPGKKEKEEALLLHHAVGAYTCQHDIFKNITCATAVLDNPNTAGYEIDRVLLALEQYKQPIYIELPRDMINSEVNYDPFSIGTPMEAKSNDINLGEALEECIGWINASQNPVILAGVEVARYGLGTELTKFSQRTNIPIATTLLGKSVVSESNKLALGVYCGDISKPEVKTIVEESDCLIMLGTMLTDMNFGFKPMPFKKDNIILSTCEKMIVKHHAYSNVLFRDFIKHLFKSNIAQKPKVHLPPKEEKTKFVPNDCAITTKRLIEKINSILDPTMTVIADIGDSLFGASELVVQDSNQFLAQGFYTSMGFAVPAALGAQLANPHSRLIVIVGDGAFQMTGMETSTILNQKLDPIIVVLNNKGYTTERFLKDGLFNDIQLWQYHRLPEIFGGGIGVEIDSEEGLNTCLDLAIKSNKMHILNVHVDKFDHSVALDRMTSKLAKRI